MKKFAIIQNNKIFIFDERWITINADEEEGRKGQHVLIKENGDIVFGLGGKFKNLRDLGNNSKKVVVTEDEISSYIKANAKTYAGRKLGYLSVKVNGKIINFKPVEYYKKQPTEMEIIDKLGGPDKTKGSCASLALAYTAQKGGMDVIDFRGGKSRDFFADDYTTKSMFIDSVVERKERTVKGTMELLKTVKKAPIGKEFLLATGNHMAVVRRRQDEMGFDMIDYLELQSDRCGWRTMGVVGSPQMKESLRKRFKTQVFFKMDYKKRNWECSLYDCDKLRGVESFKMSLGFINTSEDKQFKGSGGGMK